MFEVGFLLNRKNSAATEQMLFHIVVTFDRVFSPRHLNTLLLRAG
jgi:hypothetical protein